MNGGHTFPAPAPDFSNPLGLIEACHGRMREHCALLERAVAHVREQGLDDEARQALRKVHRYFGTAAPLHHMDEEQDLFPRLVRTSLRLAETIHRLRQDHEQLDRAWQELAPRLQRPPADEAAVAELQTLAATFCDLYRRHLEVEEQDFLSLARHLLSSAELQRIGRAMEERRRPGST